MHPLLLLLGGLAAGVLITSASVLVLESSGDAPRQPEPACTNDRPEARLRPAGSDSDVRMCYPATWSIEQSYRTSDDGRVVATDEQRALVSVRTSLEQQATLKPQFAEWVRAQVGLSAPPGPDESRPDNCGPSIPLRQEGDLRTCQSSQSSIVGEGAGRPVLYAVRYVMPDGYELRARVELLYDLQQVPMARQYQALEDIWPTLEAEIRQMAEDLARRTSERR